MIGLGISLTKLTASGQASDGADYDNATTALVAAMTTRPSEARIALINTLIAGLKTDGIWDRLEAFWITAAHDSQAGRLNWKTPGTFTLTENGTGTWTTDRGWAGNGTDGWLSTGLAPNAATLFQLNDATLFGWSRTAGTSSIAMFGTNTGATAILQPRTAAGNFEYRVNNGAPSVAVANADGTGFYAATRTDASAMQGYKNGAASGSAGTTTSTSRSSSALGIGRVNSGFTTVQCSVAGLGASLDATQQANLNTRLNTFMTAIGAA